MSRLIDANKLIKYIEKSRKENPHNDIKIAINHSFEHFHCIELVNEQPTAYDVDKVVEQLENEKEIYTRNYNISPYKEYPEIKQRYECICIAINKALDIVKAGGIDE